jgi:membrane protein implicated in regulation of membrane protease activity
MSDTVMWWVLAAILVALELSTGTFYLLLLAAGAVAGAVAAMFGLEFSVQLVFAAIIAGSVSDMHLDRDATLMVEAWDAQCTAQVRHRGANWTAVLAPGQVATPGAFRIKDIQGNRLVLEKL